MPQGYEDSVYTRAEELYSAGLSNREIIERLQAEKSSGVLRVRRIPTEQSWVSLQARRRGWKRGDTTTLPQPVDPILWHLAETNTRAELEEQLAEGMPFPDALESALLWVERRIAPGAEAIERLRSQFLRPEVEKLRAQLEEGERLQRVLKERLVEQGRQVTYRSGPLRDLDDDQFFDWWSKQLGMLATAIQDLSLTTAQRMEGQRHQVEKPAGPGEEPEEVT